MAFGLVPTKRAAPLLARIDALHPELADPQALMTTRWGTDRVGSGNAGQVLVVSGLLRDGSSLP